MSVSQLVIVSPSTPNQEGLIISSKYFIVEGVSFNTLQWVWFDSIRNPVPPFSFISFILPISCLDHPIFLTTKLPCMHLCCSVLPLFILQILTEILDIIFRLPLFSSFDPFSSFALMGKGLYLHLIYMMSLLWLVVCLSVQLGLC